MGQRRPTSLPSLGGSAVRVPIPLGSVSRSFDYSDRVTGNSDVTRLGKGCRSSTNWFASRSQERWPTFGFARARSAELLSNALKNFVGQSLILHGASQYYAADHRRCLKYGFPPDAQRSMSKRAGSTVVEVKGSHAIYVSQPEAVAALLEQAAKSVKTSAAA